MYCPICGKLMKQTYIDTFSCLNPMILEEICECECGVTYEFCYGNERFLDREGKEIDITESENKQLNSKIINISKPNRQYVREELQKQLENIK